jgi:hypothetical protein
MLATTFDNSSDTGVIQASASRSGPEMGKRPKKVQTMGNTHDGQQFTMGNTHDGQHLTMGNTWRWATLDDGQHFTTLQDSAFLDIS